MVTNRQAQAERTKQRLIEAGRSLLTENGLADCSVDDIVAACGVSKGTFYHHFADKNAFEAALEHDYNTLWASEVEATLEDGATLEERVDAIVGAYFGRTTRYTPNPASYVRWFYHEISRDHDERPSLLAQNERNIAGLLQPCVDSGELAADAPVDKLARIMSVALAVAPCSLMDPAAFDLPTWREKLPAHILDMLAPYRARRLACTEEVSA